MSATLRDVVFGAAVGDALGVPYEFLDKGQFECTNMVGDGTHHQPAGTWSDDTSMMIAMCDSIRRHEGYIDIDDIRESFCAWMRDGEYTPHGSCFDIGSTTSEALASGDAPADEWSNGNGSLMRIAPLAFTSATDDEIAAVSAITHAHHISCDACIMYVHIARALLDGVPVQEAVQANVSTEEPFERLATIGQIPEREIRSGGYVVETLEASLWCLLNTTSYKDCVLKAVNLGHDTDTTACVAGALAVIVYGYETIPKHWIDTLCAKDIIESCLFKVEE